jgi:hypothetical protein
MAVIALWRIDRMRYPSWNLKLDGRATSGSACQTEHAAGQLQAFVQRREPDVARPRA